MSDETKVVEEQKPAEEKPVEESPKYTDKQVNDLIAKEKGKALTKAEAEILSAAGVKSKDELAELVKMKQAQMSESEKSSARIKELEDREKEHTTRAERAEAKAEALSGGVPADKVDRVVKLALSGDYEGETVTEKIKSVIAEFPEFVASSKGGAFGKESKGESPNAEQALIDKALEMAGVKKK